MTDLARLDATAQAELIRTGEASPSELVEAAIERIERVNPSINAVIGDRFERARDDARGELPDGPFRGVPFLVKDLTLTMEGEPCYGGTRVLKAIDHRASEDSYLARHFRRAGLVTLGRTNTPEWGSTITTEPLSYGPTRNPWDLDRSVGGSSGGSGAAVAAGLVPIAHGGDGGGSIRIPASACGIVGLKPSRGRVSKGPAAGESWMGATVEGVLTRSVRDTAAALDAIAGPMPGDPYTAPPSVRPYSVEVGADPGRLRVGFLDHPVLPGAGPADPDCAEAVAVAVRLLESLGHHVEAEWPEAMGDAATASSFTKIVAVWTARDVEFWTEVVGRELGPDDLEDDNLALAVWGRGVSATDYLATVDRIHRWSRRVVEWWQPLDGGNGFDILVTPTIAAPPPPIGHLTGPEGGKRLRGLMQFTSQFNLTGQPAISLPLHLGPTGLPIGVQLVAAPWREDLLVRVASQLEAAAPWADRTPPIHA